MARRMAGEGPVVHVLR